MDANVHLLLDVRPETIARFEGQYEDLIVEAAQIALKNGVTTVFDTWGPREALTTVRDRIQKGLVTGSRIFCAGNIVGLDGPLSLDFHATSLESASVALIERTNAAWTENVGPALSWMTPQQVAKQVRAYITKGIDFIKYASSEHRWPDRTAFLLFSPEVQARIVEEAHRAGLTAQAHVSSVESVRVAMKAGCDILQHCNITGQVPIPHSTLKELATRKIGAVVFPFTKQRFKQIIEASDANRRYFSASEKNCLNLIRVGAVLMLATDGGIFARESNVDPRLAKSWAAEGEDNLGELGHGHFAWLKAMEEKGLSPIEGLRAATRNIALAYKRNTELGTLEPGKIADIVVLDKDPLQSAENYRSIHMILKDGVVVDRSKLPTSPILTRSVAESPHQTLV